MVIIKHYLKGFIVRIVTYQIRLLTDAVTRNKIFMKVQIMVTFTFQLTDIKSIYFMCIGSLVSLEFLALGVRETSTSINIGTSLSRSVSSSQESFLTVLGMEPLGHSILWELSMIFVFSSD